MIIALTASTAAADITFRSRTDIKVGSAPTDVAFLPHDGGQLLVADDAGLALLAPLNGQAPVLSRIDSKPFAKSVALAPLAGKTALDLAYLAGSERSVYVATADGPDRFANPVEVATRGNPIAVRAASIDGAGKTGVFVAHDAGVTLLQPERGGVRPIEVWEGPFAAGLEIADLNGDKNADLIIADASDDRLVILSGRGDWTFGEPRMVDTVREPSNVVAGDVNQDGRTDLIVVGSGGLGVQLQEGRGTFTSPATVWAQPQLTDLAAADLDRDGRLDLAVTSGNRAIVTFLTGGGDGTFDLRRSYTVGSGPTRVLLADLTADGITDAAVLNHVSDSITMLRGLGTGEFVGSPAVIGQTGDFTAMALADFDADSHLDIAVTSEHSGNVAVFLGNGRGDFAALPPTQVGHQPRGLVTSDLNRDRLPDLAVTSFSSDQVAVLTGTGRGSFAAPRLIGVGQGPSAIVSGDFQGRGPTDLAVANTLADSVSILYGDGDGDFPNVKTFSVAPRPTFLLVGDLNRDRHADLIVGNDYSDTVSILRGDGKELGAPRTDHLASSARPLVADDLDGDGNSDLIVVDETANTIGIMPGRGPGKFGERVIVPVGEEPDHVGIGDFNEDGAPDIAVLHRDPPAITILLNRTQPPLKRSAS